MKHLMVILIFTVLLMLLVSCTYNSRTDEEKVLTAALAEVGETEGSIKFLYKTTNDGYIYKMYFLDCGDIRYIVDTKWDNKDLLYVDVIGEI